MRLIFNTCLYYQRAFYRSRPRQVRRLWIEDDTIEDIFLQINDTVAKLLRSNQVEENVKNYGRTLRLARVGHLCKEYWC